MFNRRLTLGFLASLAFAGPAFAQAPTGRFITVSSTTSTTDSGSSRISSRSFRRRRASRCAW